MKLYHFHSLCPSSARGWESQFDVDHASSSSLPLPYFMCVNVCAYAYAGPCCFSALFLEKQVTLQAYTPMCGVLCGFWGCELRPSFVCTKHLTHRAISVRASSKCFSQMNCLAPGRVCCDPNSSVVPCFVWAWHLCREDSVFLETSLEF